MMKTFDGRECARLIALFSALSACSDIYEEKGTAEVWERENAQRIRRSLDDADKIFAELGLMVAVQRLKTVRQTFQVDPINTILVGGEFGELETTMREELATRLFMSIEPTSVRYFTDVAFFGPEVAAKFPSASIDIEEAGKCFALNRGTSCMFHLMRVLEVALYALADDPPIENLQEN